MDARERLTCPRETGPLRAGKFYFSRLGRAEKLDEEVAVQRAADCVCAAAGGGGHADRRGLPQGRDQRGVVLQLAQKVWRPDAVGDEAAEAAPGGEPAAEEAGGRSVARQGDAAGRHPPKNMRPARKRQLVDEVRSVWQVSIRRACQALPVDRSTYHYRCKRTGQAILMKRIKEISKRSPKRVCVTVIGAFTCCCDAKVGSSTASGYAGCIAKWACNCATNRPSDGSKRSCVRTARPPPRRTRCGPWTLSTTSCSTAARSAF